YGGGALSIAAGEKDRPVAVVGQANLRFAERGPKGWSFSPFPPAANAQLIAGSHGELAMVSAPGNGEYALWKRVNGQWTATSLLNGLKKLGQPLGFPGRVDSKGCVYLPVSGPSGNSAFAVGRAGEWS